jgi:hypothetical protein
MVAQTRPTAEPATNSIYGGTGSGVEYGGGSNDLVNLPDNATNDLADRDAGCRWSQRHAVVAEFSFRRPQILALGSQFR